MLSKVTEMRDRGLKPVIGFILALILNQSVFAQSKIQPNLPGGKIEFNKQKLKKLERDNRKEFKQNHKLALRLAEEKGWVVRKELPGGRIIALHGVDKVGNPIYYTTYSSEGAATTSTDDVWEGGDLGLSLDGSSSSVADKLGVWDGGAVRTAHRELTGRVTQQDNAGNSYDDHATHVAGIMVGGGINANAKGMAYNSDLKAWDWDNDLSEMSSAAADGLLLSNHSYGLGNIGWVYNPDRDGSIVWEWWGATNIDNYEDYRFGYYDDYAQEVDEVANNAPYYLIVVAAGNGRGSSGPGTGESYYLKNSDQTSRVDRRDQNSYDLITSFALSKNVLTVGAIYPLSDGFQDAFQVDIAEFSSLGPVDDGRVKPDIVGDGVDVLSSVASSNLAYDSYSGTSMASPNVTGSLQLLQEYFAELNNGNFLKATTLKGLAIHTADDAGNTGPDYTFGWGVLNTAKAVKVIENPSFSHLISENSIAQNEADTLEIIASGTESLRITLCWNDPASTPLAINSAVVNNRTPLLINDLDIRVITDSGSYSPWILDPNQPELAASTGDNTVDNVEQIFISAPVPGKTYKVIVSHKGTLQNNGQQYSLIISGIGGDLYCASEAEDEQGAKIEEVNFGSIDYTASAGCTTYSDLTDQFAEVLIRHDDPLELSVTLSSCDAAASKIVKAFVDWNADFDFDDEGELIATSGIIIGDGVFSASVELPDSLDANTFTRMRIVCVETSEENEVSSCGTYSKGETLDHSIKFIAPSYDIAPVALVSPNESTCSNTTQKIQVKIKNIGAEEVENIPVTVSVTTPDSSTSVDFSGSVSGILLPDEEKTVVLDGNLDLLPDTEYSYFITTGFADDHYKTNDTLSVELVSAARILPPSVQAYVCDDTHISLISDEEEEATFWYASADAEVPIGSGKFLIAGELPDDSVFYAAINDLKISLGPKDKYEFDGGSYGAGFVPQPLITTEVPLVIDSARLYIGNAGRLTFTVLTSSGTVISTSEIEVEETRNPSVSGDSDDDLADEGAMYAIGLEIPEPGDYLIQMDYEYGASVYRSNEGVSGFPFSVPGTASLTGALYEGDTLTDAYYYLYDIKIRSIGCKSERVAVQAVQGPEVEPVITTNDPTTVCNGTVTLQTNSYENHTYQWEKDGEIVAITTDPFYEATVSGIYDVIIYNDQCVYSDSNTIEADITSIDKPEIIFEGEIIVSSSADSNQWYLDGEEIEDAIEQEYDARIAGYYAVRVSNNSCYIFSDSLFVYVEPPVSDGLWLYPNPTVDVLTVRFRYIEAANNMYIEVYDILGKKVEEIPLTYLFEDIYEAVMDVTGLPEGVYVLRVSQNNKAWSERFVKQ